MVTTATRFLHTVMAPKKEDRSVSLSLKQLGLIKDLLNKTHSTTAIKAILKIVEFAINDEPEDVPFSEATYSHVEVLVEPGKLELETEFIRQQGAALEVGDAFFEQVEAVEALTFRPNEAGDRMLIDPFLLEAARLSNAKVANPPSRSKVKVVPEVKLPQTRHKVPNSSDICLKGKIDYITVTIPIGFHQLPIPVTPQNSSRWISSTQGRLTLIEAKHASIDSGFPEVITQGLNALQTFNLNSVRLILTTGLDWQFFILKRDSENGGVKEFHSDCLVYDPVGTETERKGQAKTIMALLVNWIECASDAESEGWFTCE